MKDKIFFKRDKGLKDYTRHAVKKEKVQSYNKSSIIHLKFRRFKVKATWNWKKKSLLNYKLISRINNIYLRGNESVYKDKRKEKRRDVTILGNFLKILTRKKCFLERVTDKKQFLLEIR